jgi:hypothetical protein
VPDVPTEARQEGRRLIAVARPSGARHVEAHAELRAHTVN